MKKLFIAFAVVCAAFPSIISAAEGRYAPAGAGISTMPALIKHASELIQKTMHEPTQRLMRRCGERSETQTVEEIYFTPAPRDTSDLIVALCKVLDIKIRLASACVRGETGLTLTFPSEEEGVIIDAIADAQGSFEHALKALQRGWIIVPVRHQEASSKPVSRPITSAETEPDYRCAKRICTNKSEAALLPIIAGYLFTPAECTAITMDEQGTTIGYLRIHPHAQARVNAIFNLQEPAAARSHKSPHDRPGTGRARN